MKQNVWIEQKPEGDGLPLFQLFEPGIQRDIAIGLKYVIIILCFEFSALLFRDWMKARRANELVPLLPAWLLFFSAYTVTEILYVIADIYGLDRADLLHASYSLMIAAATGIVYVTESHFPYHTRGFFWKFCACLAIITAILPRESSQYLMFAVVAPIMAIFSVIFLMGIKRTVSGPAGRPIWLLFIGIFVTLAGNALSSDIVIGVLGLWSYVVGNAVIAAGFALVGFNALVLRNLAELDWASEMKQLLITNPGGTLLLSLNLDMRKVESEDKSRDYLSAGGLSGINQILKEISGSEANVRYIDHQDSALLFFHGEHVVGILFAKRYLDILYWKLRKTVTLIESAYAPLFVNSIHLQTLKEGMKSLALKEFHS